MYRVSATGPDAAPHAPRGGIIIIDNYDSFTYNTVQLLGELGVAASVLLNDRTTLAQIEALEPGGILLSAGPGTPEDAGITVDVIHHFAGHVPLFGVCLGHQAIAHAFGARVVRGGRLMHGKACRVEHDGRGIFQGLPNPAIMARYNSLLVEEASLPADLRVTARSSEGEVMALCHVRFPIQGVQFHPESVLSEGGKRLLANWIEQLVPEHTWSMV
jgi:anthranilate synthase/aminodeoxychorismate synthase-like glutamine amidotransferase